MGEAQGGGKGWRRIAARTFAAAEHWVFCAGFLAGLCHVVCTALFGKRGRVMSEDAPLPEREAPEAAARPQSTARGTGAPSEDWRCVDALVPPRSARLLAALATQRRRSVAAIARLPTAGSMAAYLRVAPPPGTCATALSPAIAAFAEQTSTASAAAATAIAAFATAIEGDARTLATELIAAAMDALSLLVMLAAASCHGAVESLDAQGRAVVDVWRCARRGLVRTESALRRGAHKLHWLAHAAIACTLLIG